MESVRSGYSGGTVSNPTYDEVCTGETGHAEVIQISYDPKIISYEDLLEVFWKTHDPTTLNRQGEDVGTQYRSVIFYHNLDQKELAISYKNKLDDAKIYDNPIVTEITEFTSLYKAENYHNDYYTNNKAQSYCSFVITPKIEKFKKVFKDSITLSGSWRCIKTKREYIKSNEFGLNGRSKISRQLNERFGLDSEPALAASIMVALRSIPTTWLCGN